MRKDIFDREIYLVCIARNEDHYIEEWIQYHLKLGFEKIVIFAHLWKYDNKDPRIIIINCSGEVPQELCYNYFIKNFQDKFWWVAFIDVDEFLVLNKHNCIKNLLLEYDDLDALVINWALFGNNNHEKVYNEYSVLKRFTKRSLPIPYVINNDELIPLNVNIKTIMRYTHTGVYYVHEPQGILHTLKREPIRGPENVDVDYSVAQLNHYFIKSFDEMKIRILLPKPDRGYVKEDNFYYVRNPFCNVVDDYKARDFLYSNSGLKLLF